MPIYFNDHYNLNLPNFIIAHSGQSNAEGYGSRYDPNNLEDQPDNRIFGWNPNASEWQIADLNTESLGWNYETFKQIGNQSSAFHFAKKLVENYPGIRPGIVNVGVSGAVIGFWTNWKSGDEYYDYTMHNCAWFRGKNTFPFVDLPPQGYVFDVHIDEINKSLQKIPDQSKIVNVLLWQHGEGNPELDYLQKSLYHVIDRYINTFKNLGYYDENKFGFISISTTGMLYEKNGIKVNDVLQTLNNNSSYPNARYISCTDLEVSYLVGSTTELDPFHFNADSQRTIGKRTFETYNNMH